MHRTSHIAEMVLSQHRLPGSAAWGPVPLVMPGSVTVADQFRLSLASVPAEFRDPNLAVS